MKALTSILVLLLIHAASYAGGPWTPAQKKGFFKLSEWWVIFDQHYTDNGLIDPNVTTGIFNTSLYGEYGLSDRFALGLYLPFFSRNYTNNLISNTTGEILVPGEALNAIGDTDLQLKYRLTKSNAKVPVAVSVLFGLPIGKLGGGTQGNLQTGDGEFNQLLQIDAGSGFQIGKHNIYFIAYTGLNNRTKGFSDEWRGGLEFGVSWFKQKLWTIFRLQTVESFKNGDTAANTNATSIFANNSEFTSPSIELSYYFKPKWGVSAGMASAIRGEVIAASPSYSIGIFYDMTK